MSDGSTGQRTGSANAIPVIPWNDARQYAGTGDAWLWQGKSDLDYAIQANESSKYPIKCNHASVSVCLQGIRGFRILNYEGTKTGFDPHGMSREIETFDGHVYWLKLKDGFDRGDIEERCFHYEHTPYDFKGLVKMAVTRPEIDVRHMICSVAVYVMVSGITTGRMKAPWELLDLGYWEAPAEIIWR